LAALVSPMAGNFWPSYSDPMAKTAVVSAQPARGGGKLATSQKKRSAPKKIKLNTLAEAGPQRAPKAQGPKLKLGSFSIKGTRIDPLVAAALASDSTKSSKLTVMVKLNPRSSQFAQYSVSNESGNERQRIFRAEVEEMVKRTVGETGKVVKVLSRMPNVGVATVQAQPSALRTLLEDDKIVGVQLAAE
jgi:hypothetical protein